MALLHATRWTDGETEGFTGSGSGSDYSLVTLEDFLPFPLSLSKRENNPSQRVIEIDSVLSLSLIQEWKKGCKQGGPVNTQFLKLFFGGLPAFPQASTMAVTDLIHGGF